MGASVFLENQISIVVTDEDVKIQVAINVDENRCGTTIGRSAHAKLVQTDRSEGRRRNRAGVLAVSNISGIATNEQVEIVVSVDIDKRGHGV